LRGGGAPFNPRALACLVSRDSELAYLFRSLTKVSPPPPHVMHAVMEEEEEEEGDVISKM